VYVCVGVGWSGRWVEICQAKYIHKTHPVHGRKIGVGADPVEARGEGGEVVEGVDVVAFMCFWGCDWSVRGLGMGVCDLGGD
jgi:hypothetical protein